ncbi:cathepsin d [Plakobranchus ocellatus]|uniref:Cathepsin d n=1 Tax=Plakobranchus ocellatus TaxID=259542 RepID=A0AAV3YQU4_9GAST|nr:cathepsin d [Plakobranchus ocellatus]
MTLLPMVLITWTLLTDFNTWLKAQRTVVYKKLIELMSPLLVKNSKGLERRGLHFASPLWTNNNCENLNHLLKRLPWQDKGVGTRLWQHRRYHDLLHPPTHFLSKPPKQRVRDFRISASASDIKLKNHNNNLYYAPIAIGTPGQEFNVTFHTDSPITWVPSIHSPDRQIVSRIPNKYNNESSSTYKANGKPFEISYDSGQVSGYRSQDNVVIAGATVHNQTFGESIVEPSMFNNTMNDGVLGLGFSKKAAGKYPTVLDNMMSQGLLPAPVFSFYLNSHSNAQGIPPQPNHRTANTIAVDIVLVSDLHKLI